jgi:uncharacterized linocin/CFP29 family protein
MANDPQVPWTDEQWARVNQVIQEEAKRARVAATFLPLHGPLSADSDYVRRQDIHYPFIAGNDGPQNLEINDRDTMRLATLQVIVPVRNAQMADPEMSSVLALFRRAANVVARLEDAVVFRGLVEDPPDSGVFVPLGGLVRLPEIWQITGALAARGIWWPGPGIPIAEMEDEESGQRLVAVVSDAIGQLEQNGHFGPFAAVLGQRLFLVAQTPDENSLVLPQDRIIPFLGGGPLLRSSTLDDFDGNSGVVIALGGSPVELVVATDMCLQFLQVTNQPAFLFRVSEKIALRIREPDAIVKLQPGGDNGVDNNHQPSPARPQPAPKDMADNDRRGSRPRRQQRTHPSEAEQ